ncbi:MAG: hypothetical protein KKB50_01305 [Planctomycetes bacterium]|nr:hypothetical protein [Planctomycetota bacterium]
MTEILTPAEATAPQALSPPAVRVELERQYARCELIRPFRRRCYDPGDVLELPVTGVMPAHKGTVTAEIERFVGGGFAGQVYRVRLRRIELDDGPLAGLHVGQTYAIKILKPPSGFACFFRDTLYFLAYQGVFGAQANPAAVRVGVLWQKLIRRAAASRLGADNAVCDTYATFYDAELRSFGEINEWVTGRIWKFEVDERLFERWKFDGPAPADASAAEYIHKRAFMRELVQLLHEMGAGELARQYEWWTCKSQPNALKRTDADHHPRAGLTAIDFRAGLALLPFLPMSPADFWLIARGLIQGRLVQFDHSDLPRFRRYIADHRDDFEDLQPAITELEEQEARFRRALPDITHHHIRLLTDRSLQDSVRCGTITAWRNLGRVDQAHAARLERSHGLFMLVYALSLIPSLGRLLVKLCGHAQHRAHLGRCLSSPGYFWRALRGARIEALVAWQRNGRVSDERARRLVQQPVRFWLQRIGCGWMPAKWHRFFTEPSYAWQRLKATVSFTFDFLRNPPFRENWLLEQVSLGREEGMLTPAEAAHISDQIKDPFIQKYLKCLAAHLCTVPVTQVVMVIAGAAVAGYCVAYKGLGWPESIALGTAAAAAIQLMPISPGSITRGVFVLYLMIRERDIRNYYIAAPISFLHVIGYLAFPLQMVAHDAALARFMAGRWAKSAVHVIPVFGESGALAEHAIFDLFFNFPLSLKRSFKTRPIQTTLTVAAILAAIAYPLAVLGTLAQAAYYYWLA